MQCVKSKAKTDRAAIKVWHLSQFKLFSHRTSRGTKRAAIL